MAKLNINDLKGEVDHLKRCDEDLLSKADVEGREFTEAERREVDTRSEQIDELEKQIRQIEVNEQYIKKIAARTGESRQTPHVAVTDGKLPEEARKLDIEFSRTGTLKAFHGPDANFRAYKSGQWIMANIFGKQAAKRWCREQGMYDEMRAHSENIDSAGGFLVPNEFSQAIIDNREQYGTLRKLITPYPMGSETAQIPVSLTGLTATFTTEGGSLSESDTTWGNVGLVAKDLDILTRYSMQLDEDSVISIADRMAVEFARAFAYTEDNCGFNGDGTSAYGGITGIVTKLEAATTSLSYVLCAPGHDTYPEIDYDDISKLMGALPEYAEPNAKFICSRLFSEMVFGSLKATAGGTDMIQLSGKLQPSYLGYPIVTSQVMPRTSTTTNLKVVALFGDLDLAMKMGDRRGIQIMKSDQAYFTTKQIGLRATERIDIVTHDIGDTTKAGPVVALVTTTS